MKAPIDITNDAPGPMPTIIDTTAHTALKASVIANNIYVFLNTLLVCNTDACEELV